MAFQDTLKKMMKKHNSSKPEIAEIMQVDVSQVYRYLNGKIEPKWKNVLLLFEGLGYDLKITKKED